MEGRKGEESLGYLTSAPLQRSTLIKGMSALEFTFPIKGPTDDSVAEIFIRWTSAGNGQMLGANGATAQCEDSLKTA